MSVYKRRKYRNGQKVDNDPFNLEPLFADVPEEQADVYTPKGGLFGTRKPKDAEFRNPLVSGEDALALGLKSVIPIAELIGSNKRLRNLRKKLPTKFSRANLNAPVVRDMARPSFAPRTRAPLGSSLAERTAGQKFGDAYQNAQEANFEIQNEMQKRQQEARNFGVMNQEELTNVQIANQEAQLNAGVNRMDYQHALGRRDVALNALNYYLATDPNQLIQSKHMRGLGRANYIIEHPDDFSEKELANADRMIRSVAPTNTTPKQHEAREATTRNGRKLKTKFGYGR